MKANGILIKESKASVSVTMDHLEEFLKNHGATIYLRLDQRAEALKSGVELLPLEYLLFGNPTKGSALMKTDPLIGLDLPLKIIAWADKQGKTQIAFNQGEFIAERYGISLDADSPLNLEPMIAYVLKNQIPTRKFSRNNQCT